MRLFSSNERPCFAECLSVTSGLHRSLTDHVQMKDLVPTSEWLGHLKETVLAFRASVCEDPV